MWVLYSAVVYSGLLASLLATAGRLFHPGITAMRGGPPIERCGAELLSALLPKGKVQESQVFRYFT